MKNILVTFLFSVILSGCATSQIAKDNLAWTNNYLKNNSTRPEVVTLESGLQYKVLKTGKGQTAKNANNVLVHYEGKLAKNDMVFDSTYTRGNPTKIPLWAVIDAWKIGIPLMKEGDKWEFYTPPWLAYGDRGAGYAIGPNVTLIFTVEVIKVID